MEWFAKKVNVGLGRVTTLNLRCASNFFVGLVEAILASRKSKSPNFSFGEKFFCIILNAQTERLVFASKDVGFRFSRTEFVAIRSIAIHQMQENQKKE